MTAADEIRQLYEYNSWANARVLEACAALSAEQRGRDLGTSHHSVHETLAHILGAEWVWLERWKGRSPTSLPAAHSFADLAQLRARWSVVEQDLLGFVRALGDSDLDRKIEYRTTEGRPYTQPFREMLQHLLNHGTYHRGQVSAMLRQLGGKPASTDLIVFYRERAARSAQ
jgi:uncharacterized damage-inducible protein DinB